VQKDITLLTGYFCERTQRRLGLGPVRISTQDTNVQLSSPDLVPMIAKKLNLQEAVQKFKKQLIQRALTKNDGNWAATAKELGMHRSNLHHLAARLGLREKVKKRGY